MLGDHNTTGNTNSIDVFKNNNIGCYYRYFKRVSEIDITTTTTTTTTNNGQIQNFLNTKPSSIKNACAVIHKNINGYVRMEVAYVGESEAYLYYFIYQRGDAKSLSIYKFKLTKSSDAGTNNSSSNENISATIEQVDFKHNNSDGDSSGIMDLVNSNTPTITTTTTTTKTSVTVSFDNNGEKRDEYCNRYKYKRMSSKSEFNSEMEKIKERCSSGY